jgi:hypothetical protein
VQILFWPTGKFIGLVALPLGATAGNPAAELSASGEAETGVVLRKVFKDFEKQTNYPPLMARGSDELEVVCSL